MSGNPIKFVKVMNTGSGIPQVIPMSTWERLGSQPKALKSLEFMYHCDENGTKIESGESPKVETKTPLFTNSPIEEALKSQIDTLNATIADKDKQLAEAKTIIENKDKEIADSKSDNEVLAQENKDLNAYADESKKEIEALKAEIETLKKKPKKGNPDEVSL